MCYCSTHVSQIHKELNNGKEEEIPYKEAVKKCGENWGKMNEKDKKKYDTMAQEEQKIYEKEMEEFDKTGYFTDKDGVHSSKKTAPVPRGVAKNNQKDDTVRPKRAPGAYQFFVKETAKNIIKENNCKSAADGVKLLG